MTTAFSSGLVCDLPTAQTWGRHLGILDGDRLNVSAAELLEWWKIWTITEQVLFVTLCKANNVDLYEDLMNGNQEAVERKLEDLTASSSN